MAQVNKSKETLAKSEIAGHAKRLLRRAFTGSLSTIDRDTGHPYASLVTVATSPDGEPVLLISSLARHTANLTADPRTSILVGGSEALADPLQGARLTLWGKAERTETEAARRRFLARHPEAGLYADFPDFAFWRIAVEGAHYIGGFGRIFDLGRNEMLLSLDGAEALLEAEPGIVAHMNQDHAGALELYATVLAGAPAGEWRMTGIDPEGCDIALERDARRIPFATRVTTPEGARKELVRLAAEAREAKS